MKKILVSLTTIALLVFLSFSVVASNDSSMAILSENTDTHDIGCKYDCPHENTYTSKASNEVRIVTREEMISNIANATGISIEEAEKIIKTVENASNNTVTNVESIDSSLHNINCKFDCVHNDYVISNDYDNISAVSDCDLDTTAVSNDGCAHFFSLHECGDQDPLGNCIVICYGTVTCQTCGMTFPLTLEHEEHSWTNGGVCGRQCTSCGRVEYNPGHGPGSGHSWCTND